MSKFALVLLSFGVLAAAPAQAQGTAKQRAACERDAHKFCAAEQPDALAVEKCLKANFKSLSASCRRQFGKGGR